MNKEVRGVIGVIRDKILQHHATVDMAMADFRGAMEYERIEAAKYKDEKAQLKERQGKAAQKAKAAIDEADKVLVDALKGYYIPKLKEIVASHVAERPPRDFIELLKVYKDFGLNMEKGELDNLLALAGGNFIALKALSTTAKGCGWYVSAPSVDTYQKQIGEIEKLAQAPIQYCSNGYFDEGTAIYQSARLERGDGKGYYFSNVPITTEQLIINASRQRRLLNQLENMGEEWAAAFVPEISSLSPIKNKAGEVITVEEQHTANIKEAAALVEVNAIPTRAKEIWDAHIGV